MHVHLAYVLRQPSSWTEHRRRLADQLHTRLRGGGFVAIDWRALESKIQTQTARPDKDACPAIGTTEAHGPDKRLCMIF